MSETVSNEIAIEIATSKNQNFLFGPLGHLRIRGRWDFHKVAGRFSHDAMKMLNQATDIIPGECIAVDIENRTCRLFDPLRETERGRELWAKIEPIVAEYQGHFECGTKLREPVVIADCNEDTLKTWLYYMRRAVDAGHAKVISKREIPPLEKIRALPGRREAGFFANTQFRDEEAREKSRWRDIVPLGKTAAKARAD